jgi:hypothetical protein
MGAIYNGNAANVTAHEAPSTTIPVDTDQVAPESFNVAYRDILDFLAFLQAKAPLLDAVNTFVATQQIASGGLDLTQAALQAILKKGSGKLQIGTATGNNYDVELLLNGVVKATLRALDRDRRRRHDARFERLRRRETAGARVDRDPTERGLVDPDRDGQGSVLEGLVRPRPSARVRHRRGRSHDDHRDLAGRTPSDRFAASGCRPIRGRVQHRGLAGDRGGRPAPGCLRDRRGLL